jgi:hypothetical protein
MMRNQRQAYNALVIIYCSYQVVAAPIGLHWRNGLDQSITLDDAVISLMFRGGCV